MTLLEKYNQTPKKYFVLYNKIPDSPYNPDLLGRIKKSLGDVTIMRFRHWKELSRVILTLNTMKSESITILIIDAPFKQRCGGNFKNSELHSRQHAIHILEPDDLARVQDIEDYFQKLDEEVKQIKVWK